MYNQFANRTAEIITRYSLNIQPGDVVYMTSSTLAAPLVEALYVAILDCGGHPIVQLALPGLEELFLRRANDDQLAYVDPAYEARIDKLAAYIYVNAPENLRSLATVDVVQQAKRQEAMREVSTRFYQLISSSSVRYMYVQWPTPALAQEAGMGLHEFSEFMYRACALDQPDPLAYWQETRTRQERLVAWLKGKKHAEVRGPGIELSFDFADRLWVSCHGTLNFPDGEIYTCPVEDSVNGHVAFSYPSLYNGQEVDGIQLTFKDGVVTEASARKAESFLISQLDTDPGARRLGEFAIGTNRFIQRYTGSILFDEKIGGTIHMAVGNSAPQSNGANQSAIHWDMIHGMQDGGEIRIDGELFYQNGQFMVE